MKRYFLPLIFAIAGFAVAADDIPLPSPATTQNIVSFKEILVRNAANTGTVGQWSPSGLMSYGTVWAGNQNLGLMAHYPNGDSGTSSTTFNVASGGYGTYAAITFGNIQDGLRELRYVDGKGFLFGETGNEDLQPVYASEFRTAPSSSGGGATLLKTDSVGKVHLQDIASDRASDVEIRNLTALDLDATGTARISGPVWGLGQNLAAQTHARNGDTGTTASSFGLGAETLINVGFNKVSDNILDFVLSGDTGVRFTGGATGTGSISQLVGLSGPGGLTLTPASGSDVTFSTDGTGQVVLSQPDGSATVGRVKLGTTKPSTITASASGYFVVSNDAGLLAGNAPYSSYRMMLDWATADVAVKSGSGHLTLQTVGADKSVYLTSTGTGKVVGRNLTIPVQNHTGTVSSNGVEFYGMTHSSADTVAQLDSVYIVTPTKTAGTLTSAVGLEIHSASSVGTLSIHALDAASSFYSVGAGSVAAPGYGYVNASHSSAGPWGALGNTVSLTHGFGSSWYTTAAQPDATLFSLKGPSNVGITGIYSFNTTGYGGVYPYIFLGVGTNTSGNPENDIRCLAAGSGEVVFGLSKPAGSSTGTNSFSAPLQLRRTATKGIINMYEPGSQLDLQTSETTRMALNDVGSALGGRVAIGTTAIPTIGDTLQVIGTFNATGAVGEAGVPFGRWRGVTSNAAPSGSDRGGDMYYDGYNGVLYIHNGTSWYPVQQVI